MTLGIVQLIYNTFPGALRLRDNAGDLPIHSLCCNKDLDKTNSLDILRFRLSIDPTLSREVVGGGYLPIHYAVMEKSTSFCKILIDAYLESLRVETSGGWLPIHEACEGDRDDTAEIQFNTCWSWILN